MDERPATSDRIADQLNDIPLADEDAPDDISDDSNQTQSQEKLCEAQRYQMDGQSFESIPSVYTNGTDSSPQPNSFDPDLNADEIEEKERLITQVLELQNTLDDLSQRVDSVKEENLKLKSENQVLGQYIENLMSASSVFQSTSPKSKKKTNNKK
ncbi:short coiled-coil protein-like [Oppia nitens]|uniref:short coiled-coil protein-like n=1 Tax=Oppia nitens TaxID=1686743 RepID=UPI0023DA08CF|nr:short coiled-coil protein-like [Oppia nitens]